jgi:hypothetical protein
MNFHKAGNNNLGNPATSFNADSCETVRAEFSAYLDGAVTGVAMAAIAEHLEACDPCSEEFNIWRTIQQSLGELGTASTPVHLQAQLLEAIAVEREQGTHLSLPHRFSIAWQSWLAPAALRFSGALAVAVVILGSLGWMFGAPITVQANDDNIAHLAGPHYMYSEVPPQPIMVSHDVPILVDAKVDTTGRVYDYAIVTGPKDSGVQLRVEQNLLASVFKPATAFGIPVRGHVVLTYMGVSVRG